MPKFQRLPFGTLGNNSNVDWAMYYEENDGISSAKKFRDYADECRRLAQRASEKDRRILMEIAQAWDVCAEEAERKEGRKN